ncbi:immunoglobulin alpha Fc receptor isoform X4 [Cebus imitator]|uniref:immunoglobulin alpha Fc receptor isoform X4 n=1 Tax=Cebus imitator TaxID=2715852 RepID=UPI001896F06A|nr:immunoglobulin alpha Fc receptor isoform X4 [Cebus imitator]
MMAPKETTLLCLVLCLGQRIQAQEGDFPMPLIFARSSPVVPRHGSAKIQCQSSPESFLTQLVIQKNSTYKEVDRKLGFLNESEFIVDHMDTNTAGRYHCRYRRGFTWSQYSNALELVVTDSVSQDYTVQNLIRMAVAGLVLMALLAILAENWHSPRALGKEASADVAELSWSKQKCQTESTFGQTPRVCK